MISDSSKQYIVKSSSMFKISPQNSCSIACHVPVSMLTGGNIIRSWAHGKKNLLCC